MARKKKEEINYCKFILDLDTPIDEIEDQFERYLRQISTGKIQDQPHHKCFHVNYTVTYYLQKYVSLLKYKQFEYKVSFNGDKMLYEIL